MARDNLRCLPPTRTLPRIRWPLQPRSRDRRASFRRARRPLSDVLTSFWVLAGPSPFSLGEGRLTSHRFADVGADALAPGSAPARPPFTRTATLFRALRASLFEARMLPADFCNCIRRTGNQPGLSFPRRDGGHDHLPFLTHHARPTRRAAVTRGEPRFVREP
jgi:hypothetical protein